MIDALHKKYQNIYTFTNATVMNMLTHHQTPFDSVDMLLVTHVHRDHFDGDYTKFFLENNSISSLVAPQQVIDSMSEISYLATQIYPIQDNEAGLIYEFDGISITSIPVKHANQKRNFWVQNLAYLIDIQGFTFLHLGDMEMTEANFRLIQNATKGKVDYAIFPYWLFYDDGLNWINKKIKAHKFIAVHVPTYEKPKMEKELKKVVPNINVFLNIGEVEKIEIKNTE